MATKEPIGVLGGGSWGTTIAHLIAIAGHDVRLWLRNEEVRDEINEERTNETYLPGATLADGITATDDLEAIFGSSDLIFCAIPSKALRKVARTFGELVRGDQILISGTKGIEPKTGSRMTEVLKEETCVKKVGAISGPNLAKEILKGHPSATVVASGFPEVIERGAACLASEQFRVYGNDDLVGVELGGALKNVIAIAAGVADGLDFGANTKALIVTRGLAEIRRLGVQLGASPATFSGLAGIGDLMVTCGSRLSRNNQVGFRLGQGETLDEILDSMVEVAEGVRTARVAFELSEKFDVPMPIVEGVTGLLEGASVAETMTDLMTREARYEIDKPGGTPQPIGG